MHRTSNNHPHRNGGETGFALSVAIRLRSLAFFAALFAGTSPLFADIFYFPWEYQALYSDKVALELELKSLRQQYRNDRENLSDSIQQMESRIRSLEAELALSKSDRAKDADAYRKRIDDLKRSVEILGKKSSLREKELLEQNKKLEEDCAKETSDLRAELEKEKADHIKAMQEARDANQKEVADLKRQIEDLNRELSLQKELSKTRETELARMHDQQKQLSDKLQAEIQKGDIRLKQLHDRIIINIDEKISFDSGSAQLKSDVLPALDKIAEILTHYPENRIQVEGNTDNVPIHTARFPDNWELSTERALAVLRHILKRTELNPTRFTAAGYGEFHPAVPNDTPQNRALNRRVDIVLIPSSLEAAQ